MAETSNPTATAIREEEARLQKGRLALLEQPMLSQPPGIADFKQPTFLIGPANDFPGLAAGRMDDQRGHLSPPAFDKVVTHLTAAAESPSPHQRELETRRAANVVAQDVVRHNQSSAPGAKTDQVAFSSPGIRSMIRGAVADAGHEAGLSAPAANALGYSFQRALEREGLKTAVNHAVDGVNHWRASAATAATQLGQRYNLDKAMNALAERGITGDKLKQFVGQHAGKLSAGLALADNKQELMRAVTMLRESGATVQGISRVLGDKAVREAVGDISLNAGQAAAAMPGLKAAGSVAILAGAALRGESVEDMGKHVLRAAASIAGGAAGTVVGGVFGTVAGAEAGYAVADKLIQAYEAKFEPEKAAQAPHLKESAANIQEAVGRLAANETIRTELSAAAAHASGKLEEKGPSLGRQMQMGDR